MKHLKKFNEMNNIDMNISGLKCDKCDYSDPSVKLEDYEKSIGRPCPECGESLLTQEDYDGVIQMVQAVEMLNGFSQADLDAIANNLSEEEIDGALDMMNQLKMTKTGDTEDGREKWNMGELPNKK
jgi:hypothetical protein